MTTKLRLFALAGVAAIFLSACQCGGGGIIV
jgi:hypothetical protein